MSNRVPTDALHFNLNGEWVTERNLSPTTTLLRYLRETRGLTGTKEGCAEGDCGACTVAIVENGPQGPTWRAINSCLVLLPMLQGKHVVTIEGLKDAEGYHPAQEALTRALGSQCGYCTPGVVMSLFEATYRADLDAEWKLGDQLCGNLCRCTGYRPIRDAAHAVAGTRPLDRFSTTLHERAPTSMQLEFTQRTQRYVTPVTLEALFDELDAHPDARFVVGGTDLSLEITKKFQHPAKLVSLEGLASLKVLSEGPSGELRLGAAATLSELETFTATRLPSVHRMLRYFGARQIKHRGTLGGNVCNASPIGDLAPVLLSLDARAILSSRSGEREVPLAEFFTGYRQTALRPKEILAAVVVPKLAPTTRAVAYKVSKRRELDISTVSAGLCVEVDATSKRVTVARLAFGGMAATPKRAAQAEAALVGQSWAQASIEAACAALAHDFTPLSDHRGSAEYRALVAANFLRAFFEETMAVPQPSLAPGHAASVQTR